MVVSATYVDSRHSECVSPVLACLSENGDIVGVGRHVADMSPTFPTKTPNVGENNGLPIKEVTFTLTRGGTRDFFLNFFRQIL